MQDRTDSPATPAPAARTSLVTSCEGALLAVLRAPFEGPASAVFAARERWLLALIDSLSHADTRALLSRLERPRPLPGDALATEFGRLIVERRVRILAALREQPRRLALRAARAQELAAKGSAAP